jgi:hypothetical protein
VTVTEGHARTPHERQEYKNKYRVLRITYSVYIYHHHYERRRNLQIVRIIFKIYCSLLYAGDEKHGRYVCVFTR